MNVCHSQLVREGVREELLITLRLELHFDFLYQNALPCPEIFRCKQSQDRTYIRAHYIASDGAHKKAVGSRVYR